MFKDDMDKIKRILKEGLLRNNGKYILLAMTQRKADLSD